MALVVDETLREMSDAFSAAYCEANFPTIARRLAAGGVRMAAMLNKAFATNICFAASTNAVIG